MSVVGGYTQEVTVWKTTPNGFGGYTFASPEVLMGRWEDIQQSITLKSGADYVSKSRVFLDVDVGLDDYLSQGDLSAELDPTIISGPLSVQKFTKLPDINGYEFQRIAYL